jgi:hypothetical protein
VVGQEAGSEWCPGEECDAVLGAPVQYAVVLRRPVQQRELMLGDGDRADDQFGATPAVERGGIDPADTGSQRGTY